MEGQGEGRVRAKRRGRVGSGRERKTGALRCQGEAEGRGVVMKLWMRWRWHKVEGGGRDRLMAGPSGAAGRCV